MNEHLSIEQLLSSLKDEQEQKESLSRVLGIISSLSRSYACIYYVDLSTGSFVEINPTAVASISQNIGASGDARQKFIAMSEHLVSPEFKQETLDFTDLDTVADRLQDTDTISYQFYGSHLRWCEGSFIAVMRDGDGRCTHVLWVVRPINELKEKEEAQRRQLQEALDAAEAANAAKTSFLFNMSHDIRTPMNAIIGFRNLLEKHQDDPVRRADYLRKIEESSSVLLSIINNVLEMARIEKGTVEIDESAWSVEQLLDTAYSVFDEQMKAKGLTFTRQNRFEHNYVYCDSIKLREIFFNILSNAYKYTPTGGKVSMLVEEQPCDRDGYVLFRTTISDTGMGMSADFLPHLFEEFSRENNSTGNKIQGTGLGMSIVKRLVELMQGTIGVQSQQGVGTTVVVTIPHRLAERELLVNEGGVELDPKLFRGKRILLAEDNQLNAEIAIEILSESGFIVDHVDDGDEAVAMLEQKPEFYYSMVLMDIQMPRMNGYEATRAIRRLAVQSKAHIPIIAMTANAFEEDKRQALNAGMNDHVAKPFNVHVLMKAIAKLL